MTLSPGYNGESFAEYWRVWIDYNQDDDFNDNGELVYDSDGGYEGLLNISFQVRSTANSGNTRMRVAMKWVGNFDDGTSDYSAPSSCGTFDFGEVEDYIVNITNNSTGGTDTYCDAFGDSAANEWIQSIALNNIDKNSGSDNGYGNYTNLSTNLNRNQDYTIYLNPGYSGENYDEYWRVWIDYNQDDDFNDNGELVYDANGGITGNTSASFRIPSGATLGNTRIRIAMKWVGNFNDGTSDYSAPNSCGVFEFGEVEDYTVNITNNSTGGTDTYCDAFAESATTDWIQSISLNNINKNSGSDNGYGNYTNLSTNLNRNQDYTIYLNPGYAGQSFEEYWRVWIDFNQDEDFNDLGELVYDTNGGIVGNTSANFRVPSGVTLGNTRMRVAMKWVGNFNDGTSDYSAPNSCGVFEFGEVEDYTVNITNDNTGGSGGYCALYGGSAGTEWIQRIQVGSIDNNSGNNNGYGDFSNLSTTIAKGGNTNIELVPAYSADTFDEYWRIWVDLNQDNDFDDNGELIYDPGQGQVGTVSTNISIPLSAVNGSTRMRIAMKWVGNFDDGTSDYTAPNNCGTFDFGEVEDYSINITNPTNVTQAPNTNFTANQTSGNAPLIVQFADQSSNNPTTWSWTFEGGSPNSSTAQNPLVTFSNPGTYNVTLVASNSGGSDIMQKEGYITVTGDNTGNTQAPIANFRANLTSGTAPLVVTFSDLSTNNPSSWVWLFEGGLPGTSTEQNPTITYNNPGTYSVTQIVTNSNGSDTEEKTAYITITAPTSETNAPVAAFTANQTTGTAPQTINFFDQSTNNPTTWNWFFDGGTPNTSTVQNPSVTYNTPGIYSVTLVASNADGNNLVTKEGFINITGEVVNASPIASFSANQTSGNAPFNVQFSDQSSNNPTAWEWFFEGGTPTSSNEQNPSVVYSNPGVYNVTLIATNLHGNDAEVKQGYITVAANEASSPIANFTSNVTTGLAPLTVSFADVSVNTPDTWTWVFEGGNPSFSNDQNPTVVYETPGTYSVVLNVSNVIGSDLIEKESYITVLEEVNQQPIANFTSNVTSGTSPLTVTFNDLSTNNPDSWIWTFEGGTPTTSTQRNPTVLYEAAGVYEVSLTVVNASGADTKIVTDYINVTSNSSLPPLADFYASNNSGAAPFSTKFFDNSTNNPTSWQWFFPGGIPSSSTEQNPVVQYDNPGLYTVTLVATNSTGSHTKVLEDYITVTEILEAPQANFQANVTTGVAPLTVNFADISTNSPISWNWVFEGGTPTNSTSANPTVLYNEPGIYTVSLIVTNEVGSTTEVKEDYIVVTSEIALPKAEFTANTQSGSLPLTVSFFDQSTNAPNAWNWSFEGGDPTNSTAQNPTVVFNEVGTYAVSLSVSNATGTDAITKSAYITVSEGALAPLASFSASTLQGDPPLTVTFFDLSVNTPLIWDWKFPGGTPAFSSEQNPTIIYENSGSFPVSLTVKNNAGNDTQEQENYIIVFNPTNIAEDLKPYVLISPNPTSHLVQIDLFNPTQKPLTLEVYNTLGQLIQQYPSTIKDKDSYTLDLSNVPSGLYLIKMLLENQHQTYTILKE